MEGEEMSQGAFLPLQVRSYAALAGEAFRGLLRERILYTFFFIAIFLILIGYLAALLVWGRQDRVMLNFGAFVNALAILGISIGTGSRILRSGIEDRSIYLLLARPVHRGVFLLSRWSGLALFSLAYSLLLTVVLGVSVVIVGGAIKVAFFQGMALIWIESLIASALAILLSFFLRPGLAAMSSLAYLFLGHNHEQISFLIQKEASSPGFLSLLRGVTPDLSLLLMDTRVVYDQPLALSEFLLRAGYGFGWAFMFVLFGNAVFFRKNL